MVGYGLRSFVKRVPCQAVAERISEWNEVTEWFAVDRTSSRRKVFWELRWGASSKNDAKPSKPRRIEKLGVIPQRAATNMSPSVLAIVTDKLLGTAVAAFHINNSKRRILAHTWCGAGLSTTTATRRNPLSEPLVYINHCFVRKWEQIPERHWSVEKFQHPTVA